MAGVRIVKLTTVVAVVLQTAVMAIPARAATEAVVYSFKGGAADGESPSTGVIEVDGVLYGTTQTGGTARQGTLFKVTTTGVEQVLHHFGRKGDGVMPLAAPLNVKGVLYGTTAGGGAVTVDGGKSYPGGGTVFNIMPDGTAYELLYSFITVPGFPTTANGPSNLIDVDGALCGTTGGGGIYGYGTVFCMTNSRQNINILYSFNPQLNTSNGFTDGWSPTAGLVNSVYLYGTTTQGGYFRGGTVFAIAGGETLLHNFGGSGDGTMPGSNFLIDADNTLYGTTTEGGAYGEGTLFAMSAEPGNPAYKVLYSFGKGTDAAYPSSGLIDIGGILYGATSGGGVYGKGTVFSITKKGVETVLHSFGKGTDGAYPYGGLLSFGGRLYGTTEGGGTEGKGTVFAVRP